MKLKLPFFVSFMIFIPLYGQSGTVLINSIPKCGTHLLVKAVEQLTGWQGINMWGTDWLKKPETYVPPAHSFPFFHIPYTPQMTLCMERHNITKMLFIYRDPRDMAVSLAHFLYKYPIYAEGWVGSYKHYILDPSMFNCLLAEIIKNLKTIYAEFLPWKEASWICSVSFEDLVGPQGGGKHLAQVQALKHIAEYLGISVEDKKIEAVTRSLFGGTSTFKEGKIGPWKKTFNAVHKALCKEHAGRLLIDLGYESDLNW
jgi:hypothetical protein